MNLPRISILYSYAVDVPVCPKTRLTDKNPSIFTEICRGALATDASRPAVMVNTATPSTL